MLERPLRYLAIFLSLIIATGFVLFALDDIQRGSSDSQARVTGAGATSTTAAGERARERRNGALREAVDDANDVLLAPFSGISENAGSAWVRRGVPAGLGLLTYGFLLAYGARFTTARGARRRRSGSAQPTG
ncbi:MAG: hypothetical protein Q8O56_04665 [Solirubrobacteraceae bacterium]|nr:hypothetical protein [Solirubrobacteraceae bacterium]